MAPGRDDDGTADTLSPDTKALPADSGSASKATSPMARAPRVVRTGEVLGRYELGEELGEGGMATVFKARDQELRRDVAVKVLFPHLARRDETVRRFHREARAAAGLEHANILRVYDVGGGAGDEPPFIVMELVRGRSLLGELEQHGAILAEVVACIGALLADALAVAHAAGIIHRDVKPANVMVAPGGRLLLADFGVARLETEDSLVTKTGALLGTPAYMSPEQASGDTATARSDVYSLGAMLYQLATGALPYAGSPAKVLSMIAQGALVPPVKKSAAVGPDLSRLIVRMMATEASERPASAAAVAAELRALAAASGFGEPKDELAAYFADEAAYVTAVTPRVVANVITAAKTAVQQEKLPRAIALADRATQLAPDDPAVAALVQTVTEGGRSTRRRRLVIASGIAVLLAGGATAAGFALFGGHHAAAVRVDAATADAATADAIVADAEIDAIAIDAVEIDAVVIDAAARDAATKRTLDAAVIVAAPPDAVVVAPDAAEAIDAAVAVAVEPATLAITNDSWCEVTIDGEVRGKIAARGKVLRVKVDPGPHSVKCRQDPTNKEWTKPATAVAGQEVPVGGSMLGGIAVTVGIAGDTATIDGKSYPRGATATVDGGQRRVHVQKDGKQTAEGWITVSSPCRLHENGNSVVCDR